VRRRGLVCDQPTKPKKIKNKIKNILQIGFAGRRPGKGLLVWKECFEELRETQRLRDDIFLKDVISGEYFACVGHLGFL
jgi:hypothetical protein